MIDMAELSNAQHGWSRSTRDHPRMSREAVCILTRMRLRHWWLLVPSYLHYRRVERQSRSTAGLLRFAFTVELPRTFFSISLWRDESAIPVWDAPDHVGAVRWALLHTDEIWSTEWRLHRASSRARWNGENISPRGTPGAPGEVQAERSGQS